MPHSAHTKQNILKHTFMMDVHAALCTHKTEHTQTHIYDGRSCRTLHTQNRTYSNTQGTHLQHTSSNKQTSIPYSNTQGTHLLHTSSNKQTSIPYSNTQGTHLQHTSSNKQTSIPYS